MTREEAIEELQYIKDSLVSCELSYDALDMAIESLSADVREDAKGEWIKKYNVVEGRYGEIHIPYWVCSVCGNTYDPVVVMSYNYCPNCGAKMSTQSNAFSTH